MAINRTSITQGGKALLTKQLANKETLMFTRLAIGDGEISDEQKLSDMMDMSHEVLSLPVQKCTWNKQDAVILTAQYTSREITSVIQYRELAVFADDPETGEILFCYGYGDQPEELLPNGAVGGIEKVIEAVIPIKEDVNISAYIQADTAISYADYAELIRKVDYSYNLSTDNKRRLDELEPLVAKIISDIAKLFAKYNNLENRVMIIWYSLFNNIANNRSTVNFDTWHANADDADKTDANIFKGVWNSSAQRLEF